MKTAPLALTIGDPSGIGPEIALAAWLARAAHGLAPFFLVGDRDLLAARAASLGLEIPLAVVGPSEAADTFATALPVVALGNKMIDRPGVADTANAAGTVEAIDRAVGYCRDGQASAMVTLPISKKPLYEAGFRFPGHTEYLGHLAAEIFGTPATPIMMIAGPDLRTVPVTIHIALKDVLAALTTAEIVKAGRIVAHDLKARFGIARPRLALAGLNPHAGEGGTMGHEDIEIVAPAVRQLQAEGIDAFGPLPSDTMFHARARAGYDAAICMYHDQALIPAKTLAFDEGVNVTLGLPFIRTSPDHGTAYDIAGKGVARPDSLVAALAMAARMAEQQA